MIPRQRSLPALQMPTGQSTRGSPSPRFAGAASAEEGYGRFTESAAAGLLASNSFGAPRPLRTEWEARITRDSWLDQVPTSGGHDRIPPDALAQLLNAMGEVIDRAGGSFTMHYTTVGIVADRV